MFQILISLIQKVLLNRSLLLSYKLWVYYFEMVCSFYKIAKEILNSPNSVQNWEVYYFAAVS